MKMSQFLYIAGFLSIIASLLARQVKASWVLEIALSGNASFLIILSVIATLRKE